MMKNFTKILLGLSALAASNTVNAYEWREVSKEDFGGNEQNDPIILKTEPADVKSDLTWFDWTRTYTSGMYMVVKSTEKAEVGRGYNLTNWGQVSMTAPRWLPGGDHTNPNNDELGYFMAFDCHTSTDILYAKLLKAGCSNVKFRLDAYMAVLDGNNEAANSIRLSIEGPNGNVLEKADLSSTLSDEWKNVGSKIKWVEQSVEFRLRPEMGLNEVNFVVRAINPAAVGWDFGLDDITISVEQPSITIVEPNKYNYKKSATITAEYVQSEFDGFFDGNSNIEYQWFKYDESTEKYQKISGAGGSVVRGNKISYNIASFDKTNDNGQYRVIIAASGNIGDGNTENLCAIQKDFTINVEHNEVDVDICQDSSKVVEGYTLRAPADVITKKEAYGDYVFTITKIPYEKLTEVLYDDECLNSTYTTSGITDLDPIITRDANGCPKTIQEHKLRVSAVIPDADAHICQGQTYKSDNNVNKVWNTINEGPGTKIEFEDGGCKHEQYVFVHENYEYTLPDTICKGVSYSPTTETLKTIHGCDSIVHHKAFVVEPQVVTLPDKAVCPSENFTFGGKVFNTKFEGDLEDHAIGINGCDSTTKLHLVVFDGGTIDMGDTLICRDQILFGKEYTTPGKWDVILHEETEAGCQKDIKWTVKVVEVSLKLRMFNDQTEVCEGLPLSMKASLDATDPDGNSLAKDLSYHWEPEVPQNTLKPVVLLHESTTYTIFADLKLPADIDGDAKGCHTSVSQPLKVNPMPVLVVDSVNPDNRTVEYTVAGGTMPYHMYLGTKDLGELNDNYGSQDHLPYGKHILQVRDSTGCTAEQELKIEATQPIPDVFFTPNGDGENDYWKIKDIDVYPNSIVRVYDRFGKLIYSAKGEEFEVGWDGTYNGNKMPATDYWYEIDIEEIDKVYFGHFTLIR